MKLRWYQSQRLLLVWVLSLVASLALLGCGSQPAGEDTSNASVQLCEGPEVVCDEPPASRCDGSTVVTYEPEGECADSGECVYQEASREVCSGDTPLCVDGECVTEDEQQDPSGVTYFSDFTEYPSGHGFADFERVLGSSQTMSLETVDGEPTGQLNNPQRETFYFKNAHLPSVGPGERVQLYAKVRFNAGPTSNTPHLALRWAEAAGGRQSAELYAHSDSYRYIGWRDGEFFEDEAQSEPLSFSDGDVLHFIHEVDGDTVRQKAWLDSDTEPAFVEYTDADLLDFVAGVMAFGATAEGEYQLLEWGLGVGTDAPRSASQVTAPEDGPALQVVSERKTKASISVTLPIRARWAEYRVRPEGESFGPWHKRWDANDLEFDGLNAQTDYEIEVRPHNIAGAGPTAMASFTTTDENTNPDDPPGDYEDSVEGDRQALADLYNATNGDSWTNNDGWLNGDPSNSWHGVEVDSEGRVVRLDLYDNGLDGTLPDSIGNLGRLTYLNIKKNSLTGEIPASIGHMASLEWLILAGRTYEIGRTLKEPPQDLNRPYHQGKRVSATNAFSGTIPSTIGSLSNLERLEFANQPNIKGPIPPEIGNLSELEGLYLSFNDFSGTTLPSSLGNLTKLKHLYIASAQLEGDIPSSIENLTQLRFLNLGESSSHTPDNHLTGEIPDFSNFTELRSIVITDNNLTGDYPSYWNNGDFTQMTTLRFTWNNLTGTLHGFDNLPNMKSFGLEGNNVSGTIKSQLSEVPRGIIILGLGWNNFTGGIPQSGWPDFYQLRSIRLNDNDLTGEIPCEFWEKIDNSAMKIAALNNNRFSANCTSSMNSVTGNGDPAISVGGNDF